MFRVLSVVRFLTLSPPVQPPSPFLAPPTRTRCGHRIVVPSVYRGVISLSLGQEFDDETYLERVVALKEMFPGWTRRFASKGFGLASSVASGGWWLASKGSWYLVTTGVVVGVPYGVLMLQDQQMLEEYKRLTARTEQHDMVRASYACILPSSIPSLPIVSKVLHSLRRALPMMIIILLHTLKSDRGITRPLDVDSS
jgi:hypothetical protein